MPISALKEKMMEMIFNAIMVVGAVIVMASLVYGANN